MARPFSTVGSADCRHSPEVLLERRERRRAFRKAASLTREAIAELPELYRIVVEDHLLNSRALPAIAADWGLFPGQLEVMLRLALERLREQMPAEMIETLVAS
ncbi:MAG: sigma-70 family RNA polymerase sigma factor [Armatimonadetes bacterium]|nr:sigma-70 family RNA polymerase sigma factor [Armatimonadota bacterium]